MDIDSEFWNWIELNVDKDPATLRLKGGSQPWLSLAILQIECRRKAAAKVPDELNCGRFIFPTALSAEQCTSDAVAQLHAGLVADGDSVLDLTAGLGIDVFHIARKASVVTAVDINQNVADALQHNALALGFGNVQSVCADCAEYLPTVADNAYDVVFIDPARRSDDNRRLFSLHDCRPDVVELLPQITRVARRLIVKASPMLDITATLRDLPGTTDIFAAGSKTECKELLSVVDLRSEDLQREATIHVWTPEQEFSFTHAEESEATAEYGQPRKGWYLYEPWAVTQKAAPAKLLSEKFGLFKLAPNTHLYTSPEIVCDFPGNCRKVVDVLPYASRVLKTLFRTYPKIDVATRNFPVSADSLRAKLRVAPAGTDGMRLMATTIMNGEKLLLVLQ